MRLVASLAAAAALLATFALQAHAYERTVRIPIAHCEATVETNDAYVAWNRERGAHFDRWGETNVYTNC